MTVDQVVQLLTRRRFVGSSEDDLQRGIAAVLEDAHEEGLAPAPARECQLGDHDRPDFMLGRIAIEVKIGGSLNALTRQVVRYAQRREVEGIVVVTTLNRHRNLPATINGKPCRVCYLSPLS